MSILRVEELEQRHLLSGGIFRSAAPAPPFEDGGGSARIGPPPAGMQFGGPHLGPGRFDPGPSQFGPPAGENFGPFHDGNTTNGPSGAISVVRFPNGGIEAIPGGQTSARLLDSVSSIAAVGAPLIDRGAGAATVAARIAVPSQTPVLLSVLATVPNFITPHIGVSLNSGRTTGLNGESTVVGPLTPRTVTPSSGSAAFVPPAASSDPKDRGTKLIRPIGPGLLSMLPGVDLPGLSRGLREFLNGIERSAENLIDDGDSLRPWIVAGAAAVVASEIARRQLRRHDIAANRLPNPSNIPIASE